MHMWITVGPSWTLLEPYCTKASPYLNESGEWSMMSMHVPNYSLSSACMHAWMDGWEINMPPLASKETPSSTRTHAASILGSSFPCSDLAELQSYSFPLLALKVLLGCNDHQITPLRKKERTKEKGSKKARPRKGSYLVILATNKKE